MSDTIMDKELSHVVMVNKYSKSIKTVIPRKVVDALKIKNDDVLQWEIEDGKYVRIKRLT
jgi:hypothetical protein